MQHFLSCLFCATIREFSSSSLGSRVTASVSQMSAESQCAKWVSIMQTRWGPQQEWMCACVKLYVRMEPGFGCTRTLGGGKLELQWERVHVSERLGACEEYCLGVEVVICVCVCLCLCVREHGLRWEDGKKPEECFHSSDLIYNSALWRRVRSFSRSALTEETSVPRYISLSLCIHPSQSTAPSPEAERLWAAAPWNPPDEDVNQFKWVTVQNQVK